MYYEKWFSLPFSGMRKGTVESSEMSVYFLSLMKGGLQIHKKSLMHPLCKENAFSCILTVNIFNRLKLIAD